MRKTEVYTTREGDFEYKLYCETTTNYSNNTYTVSLRATLQQVLNLNQYASFGRLTRLSCYIPNGQYSDDMYILRLSADEAIIPNDGTIFDTGTYSRTFNLNKDGTIDNVYIALRLTGDDYNGNYLSDKASNGHMNINNTWKNGYFWRKINGVWKRCLIWKKNNGIWKKGI